MTLTCVLKYGVFAATKMFSCFRRIFWSEESGNCLMTRKWTKCEHITLHDFIKISIKNGMFFVLLILQSLFTEFYFLKINYVQYSRVLNLIWVNNSTFCISCHLCLIHVTSIYLSLFFTEFVSHFKLKDIDLFRSRVTQVIYSIAVGLLPSMCVCAEFKL